MTRQLEDETNTREGSSCNSILDVVGIGYGPSNLGLAIALHEHNSTHATEIMAAFVESKPRFGWHPGMLIPGTTMQISFLKDLALQRNATSEFTFLNYLQEMGRLHHFVNHQTFFPTRIEFHDYLEWAVNKVDADVRYGTVATRIHDQGDHFRIDTERDGHLSTLNARNIVLAGGLTAKLPPGVQPSSRQFHNHNLLFDLQELPSTDHNRFVVVGAGQSAAEVASYLHKAYPRAEVHAVFGKYGYSPSDDSPYANRIFDPGAVDDYYNSPVALRKKLLDYHRGTNYSAVDLPLIEELYSIEYAERVSNSRRLFVHGASGVLAADDSDDGVRVTIEHRPTGATQELDVDAVVYATGFTPMDLPSILGPLHRNNHGDDVRVGRDYRLRTATTTAGSIYLQGGTEDTHGLTSSLLSNIAVRSGEIVDSIARRTTPPTTGEPGVFPRALSSSSRGR
ncbi:lysine N(6)-hydroxylase/L-ornithine N(5)-oxygenase family protein [Rhodococcus sp. NPDC078407]|uniref:lysine N(6)-hydroxylase/L-ornithine N(5)-oxygenase family protein n=1 Tax=Rhodococcus sp. NPDC078407 TaxID=3364509 RepID=UPI0037C92A62